MQYVMGHEPHIQRPDQINEALQHFGHSRRVINFSYSLLCLRKQENYLWDHHLIHRFLLVYAKLLLGTTLPVWKEQ
jgi:hypothetical protein